MVLVDKFQTRQDASGLISMLEENNIPFIQKSEDLGGKLPAVILPSGVKIFVSEEDFEKVNALIKQ